MLIKKFVSKAQQMRALSGKYYQNISIISKKISYQLSQIEKRQKRDQIQKMSQKALQNLLAEASFRLKPQIVLQQFSSSRKFLTTQQKIKLKLFLPKKPFNLRLGLNQQKLYLPHITEMLYKHQYVNTDKKVKILQQYHNQMDLDRFINYLYKDIYARYLLSKGIGVEWDTDFSRYGLLNSQSKTLIQSNKINQMVLNFITKCPMVLESTIGLYSPTERTFVQSKDIDVEQIKKIGYFLEETIIDFGQHSDSFRILMEKQSVVKILVFCESLQKLIQPEAICLSSGKMIIVQSQKTYLITSLDVYLAHQTYFKQNNYTKHSTFEGTNLLGMKTQNLTIIKQVEGYQRPSGLYIVSGCTSLADFQRITNNGLTPKASFYQENGDFKYLSTKFNITDPACSQKLHKEMLENNPQIKFVELYQVYDDIIYSYEKYKQVLFFKSSSKVSVKLEESFKSQLIADIQNYCILDESKVKIPRQNTFRKPRERRRFKKQVEKLKQQQTEYSTLIQSLQQIDSIPISTLKNNNIIFPIIFRKDQIFNRNFIDQLRELNNQDRWNQLSFIQLVQKLNQNKQQDQKYRLQLIHLSQKLIKGIIFNTSLNNKTISHQIISTIIIQPQSTTDQNLPYYLIIAKFLNKNQSGRKTKTKNNIKNVLPQLIKLHPTLDSTQRNQKVEQILFGTQKSNKQHQYGYGFEALRLWLCQHDSYLGDRRLNDHALNEQIQNSAFVRKVFWQILSILNDSQIQGYSKTVLKSNLYLDCFISDNIDYYIMNMEQNYTKMNLKKAYQLTNQFFRLYIDEIYLKNVRRSFITYKKWSINHIPQLTKILSLLGVISPIMPFSAYHISNEPQLKFPTVNSQEVKFENITKYQKLVKFRVQLKNRITINNWQHVWVVFHFEKQNIDSVQTKETIEEVIGINYNEFAQFLDVDYIKSEAPNLQKRKFRMKLKKNHPFSSQIICTVYQYDATCIRCDPNSKQTQIICDRCLEYLRQTM